MNKERLQALVELFSLLGLEFPEGLTDDEKLAKIMRFLPIILMEKEKTWKVRKGILGYVFGKI